MKALFFMSLSGLFFALTVGAMIFWIMMIVDLVKRDVKDKVMWMILIIFTGLIGATIYYFVVKRGGKEIKKEEKKEDNQ